MDSTSKTTVSIMFAANFWEKSAAWFSMSRPLPNAGKGRFMGRIWVEDQDFHIVRFNGAYNGSSRTNFYFHFDSWRVFAGTQQWLPAFIYSEEGEVKYAVTQKLMFKAQTRLWGYNVGRGKQEQELSKILVEASHAGERSDRSCQ